jgi:hypothetical protein
MTLTTKLVIAGAVLVIGAGFFMQYLRRDWNSQEKVEAEIRYRTAIRAASDWRGRYQAVSAESQARGDTIAKLVAANTKLGRDVTAAEKEADSLRRERGNAPNPEADALWRANLGLRVMLANESARARLIETDRDDWKRIAQSADTVITGVVDVAVEQHDRKDCSILRYIPCPSRKMAFIGGAIVTAVVITKGQEIKALVQ